MSSKKINLQELVREQRDVMYSMLGVEVVSEGECFGAIKDRVEKCGAVVLKRKKSVHCYLLFFSQYLYFFKGSKEPGYDSAMPLLVVDLFDVEKRIVISELRTSNGLIPKLKHLDDTFILITSSEEIYVKVDMGKNANAAKDWVKVLKTRHNGLTSVIMKPEFDVFLEFLIATEYTRINVSEYPGEELEEEWFNNVCSLYQAVKKWKDIFLKFRSRVWICDKLYRYLDWYSNEDANIENEFMELTLMFVKWAEEINDLAIFEVDASVEDKLCMIEKWKHVTHDEYGIKYYIIPPIKKEIYLVLGRKEYAENVSSNFQILDFTETEIIRDNSTFIKSFNEECSEDLSIRGSISETLSSRSTFSFDDRSSFSNSEILYEDFLKKPLVIDELVWKEVNNELVLIGGTKEKIVERLIIERSPEVQNDLIQSFMMTYRSIFSPLELLDQFIFTFKYLYNLSVQEQSSSETRYILIKMSNILCTWVTDHYLDFYDDETFYDIFVDKITQTIGPLDDILRQKIVTALDLSKLTFENREFRAQESDIPPPPVILPKRNTLDGFHPLELARQICLFEQKLFMSIQSVELMDQNWSKHPEKSPNVLKAIQFFNNLSAAFATKICSIDNPKGRGKILEKLFLTTTYLKEFNNYGSAMALISCTNSSSIHRMKITWQYACQRKEKVYENFQEVQEALSPEGSYKKFRDAVQCTPSPLIPYIGVYLTDLTFIDDGNSKYMDVEQERDDIVNFEKMRMISKIMVEIRRQQETPYNFEPIQGMQNFLEGVLFGMNCEEDMLVYEKSRAFEPKDKIDQYMASNNRSNLKNSVRSLNRKSGLLLSGVLKQLS